MLAWWVAEWPNIYPNLIASALWAWPAWIWHHKRVMRALNEHRAILERDSS